MVSARRIGTLKTAVGVMTTSLLVLILFSGIRGSWNPVNLRWLSQIEFVGVSVAAGYICLVQALRLGPLTIVSPVGTSVGALSVILAVALLGERPSPAQWIAICILAAGCAMAGVVRAPRRGGLPRLGPGAMFALAAAALYALVTVELRDPVRAVGWPQTLIFSRLTTSVIMLMIVACGRRVSPWLVSVRPAARHTVVRSSSARLRAQIPLVWTGTAVTGLLLFAGGFLEAIGQLGRALGLNTAPAWLIGLTVSTETAIVSSVGLIVFKERPRLVQWIGILVILGGLLLLFLGPTGGAIG
jgi:drug/metabolite transporter (DMT)-like permease